MPESLYKKNTLTTASSAVKLAISTLFAGMLRDIVTFKLCPSFRARVSDLVHVKEHELIGNAEMNITLNLILRIAQFRHESGILLFLMDSTMCQGSDVKLVGKLPKTAPQR